MTETMFTLPSSLYVPLLDLACGAFLLTGMLVLWRRDLAAIVRLFALQGIALAALIVVLGAYEHDAELVAVGLGVGALRAGLLPYLMRRALIAGGAAREVRPVVNVATSLLVAAVLAMLAYAVAQPLVRLSPTPATQAVPIALTVLLVGFFVLVTRRRALSQVVGFLLMDNAITMTAFLTTSGVPLVVELGISMDVLLAVLVLQVLTTRMRAAFGGTDLDELRELHD
jgi:hydrogenase-4 component E